MASKLPPTDPNIQSVLEQFRKWFFDEKPRLLNLLITGKTGVGKSRLVNALVGQRIAEEGRKKDPCTSEVSPYKVTIENVTVTVWDSPGLQDGTTKEPEYIQDMKTKIQDVALMIYCVRMDDTRFYDGDKKAIQILTEEFGKEVWNHAVVALTFANKVEDPDEGDELEYFKGELQSWKEQFENHFVSVGLRREACSLIPLVPVANKAKSMRLPDRENWLSDLWIECYQAMKATARQGMYRINKDRVKFRPALPPAAPSTSCRDPSSPSTPQDDAIPREIPLNEKQQESFLKSTWDAFVSGVKAVGRGFVKFGWRVLKFLFF